MIHGIIITLCTLILIASRFLYCLYDITLVEEQNNDTMILIAIILDIIGTILALVTLFEYLSII